MDKMFENFGIYCDDSINDNPSFLVACRDRGAIEERWVLTALSIEETKHVYEYLGKKLMALEKKEG